MCFLSLYVGIERETENIVKLMQSLSWGIKEERERESLNILREEIRLIHFWQTKFSHPVTKKTTLISHIMYEYSSEIFDISSAPLIVYAAKAK